jgi:ubiquinol-cytochrome c reductase cytochrome b subunit
MLLEHVTARPRTALAEVPGRGAATDRCHDFLARAVLFTTGGFYGERGYEVPGVKAILGRLYRRSRADRWSSLFGQVAVYSFMVTAITGVFLLVYYKPSMTQAVYHGSYRKLDGVPMSQAYRSTLDISFDVRGGLLMRQIHHWAALLFIAAVCAHLLRLYFTGGLRRPRWLNWLIWVTLLVLGMVAGVSGTILPDDLMSGGSLSVLEGVTLSIPVVGTHLVLWIFGGDFPGHVIIARAYWLHVAVLPVVMVALFALLRRRGRPVITPVSVIMFWLTCATLAMLGTFAQVNPVWLFGPSQPGSISAGSVPGWYMGFLDGALRIMPGWEFSVAGHPLTLAVLVPGVLVPGAFFTLLAAYPLIDRRLTGDPPAGRFLDRPRDAATRTGIGAAGITFYGLLWAAAANDEIAYHLSISLYAVTWFFRVAVLAGPVLAYTVTERMCLGLARRDRDEAEHGRETGRIVMTPDGGYHEIREPVPAPRAPVATAGSPRGLEGSSRGS